MKNGRTLPGTLKEGKCFAADDTVRIRGKDMKYHVDSQEYLFVDEADEVEASIFTYSYFLRDVEEPSKRPVIFVFGGGPGDSTFAMQVGFFGPYTYPKEKMDDIVNAGRQQLEANQEWILDVCDIVMVDSAGTGFARIYDPEAYNCYIGTDQDAVAFRKFVSFWLTKYGRWTSPKYICGESFGGLRAAIYPSFLMGGLTNLQHEVNGIVLDGTIVFADINILDFEAAYTALDGGYPCIPQAVNAVATCAATNWYHHPEGKPDLDTFIDEAHAFAYKDYIHALIMGSELDQDELLEITKKLSYYTGIPEEMLNGPGFEIDIISAINKILAAEGKSVGLYDSRATMEAGAISSPMFDITCDDAFLSAFWPTAISLMRDYMKDILNIDWNREFVAQNFDIYNNWNYKQAIHINANESLVMSLRRNRDMKLLIGRGKYDFCSLLGEGRYTVSHYGFPADRTTYREYDAGHFIYLGSKAKEDVAFDIREFITQTN